MHITNLFDDLKNINGEFNDYKKSLHWFILLN